jgi:hypothetical protein
LKSRSLCPAIAAFGDVRSGRAALPEDRELTRDRHRGRRLARPGPAPASIVRVGPLPNGPGGGHPPLYVFNRRDVDAVLAALAPTWRGRTCSTTPIHGHDACGPTGCANSRPWRRTWSGPGRRRIVVRGSTRGSFLHVPQGTPARDSCRGRRAHARQEAQRVSRALDRRDRRRSSVLLT